MLILICVVEFVAILVLVAMLRCSMKDADEATDRWMESQAKATQASDASFAFEKDVLDLRVALENCKAIGRDLADRNKESELKKNDAVERLRKLTTAIRDALADADPSVPQQLTHAIWQFSSVAHPEWEDISDRGDENEATAQEQAQEQTQVAQVNC